MTLLEEIEVHLKAVRNEILECKKNISKGKELLKQCKNDSQKEIVKLTIKGIKHSLEGYNSLEKQLSLMLEHERKRT